MSNAMVIGIGGHVVAVDSRVGTELWRTKLKGGDMVTIHPVGDRVLAGAGGELFCLDRHSGEILWRNKLKGLGMGLVTFGGEQDAAAGARLLAARQTATVAATT